MNGHLRASCHGARYILPQLVHTIRMRQILIVKGRKIAEKTSNPELIAFIHSLCGKPSSDCTLEVKGRISQKNLNGSVLAALKSASFTSGSVDSVILPCCDSIRYKSILYTVAPKKQSYRNGSFCVFRHHAELKFGSIIHFCFCDSEKVAVIKVLLYTKTTIIDNIRPSQHSRLTKSACSKIVEFCYNVKNVNKFVAVPISAIFSKCVYIPQEECQHNVIVTIPNMYEHH